MTGWKLTVRWGFVDGAVDDDVILGGRGAGTTSATNLYETVAREDRVVAGKFPGMRKENGKPCADSFLYCKVLREGINVHVCKTFDWVVHAGQFRAIGR